MNAMIKPNFDWYTATPGAKTFIVSTADELAGLAEIVNGTWGGKRDNFSGKTIKLTGDIDLSRYDNWVPIGDYARSTRFFSGVLDGGGHCISKLSIDRPRKRCQGLFGHIRHGRVENLGLDSVNISGREYVGAMVAYLGENSSLINVYSTGMIHGGGSAIGGLVGLIDTKCIVANCYSTCVVSGRIGVGGLAGIVGGDFGGENRVANCYSIGVVSGFTDVGGVVGCIEHDSGITNCYSIGAVCGDRVVGGVAGRIVDNGYVANCAALNPDVKGKANCVGRVLGSIYIPKQAVLSNNVAYAGMSSNADNAKRSTNGAEWIDGEDIAMEVIRTDPTIGGRFTEDGGWTIVDGKLPGLFNRPVDWPEHL